MTARLLRVGDSRTLWAGRFDEKFGDVFAVQDSISDRVARELPYSMALVLHGMGDSHEALRLLEAGYEQRDVRMVVLGIDPKWDPLRTDPRFVSLLRRMKLGG